MLLMRVLRLSPPPQGSALLPGNLVPCELFQKCSLFSLLIDQDARVQIHHYDHNHQPRLYIEIYALKAILTFA